MLVQSQQVDAIGWISSDQTFFYQLMLPYYKLQRAISAIILNMLYTN